MHLPEVFQNRIADCEHMAKFARDPDSKASWTRMAARWRRCAELEMTANLAGTVTYRAGKPNRKLAP